MPTAEHQFLPAALEIQETPPSPIGRAILWTLMALFTLTVLWAALGEVDIVASAPGRIIPSGRVKVIQPAETGIVQEIHVEEGQRVAAGDPLIDLDPTLDRADQQRLENDLSAATLERATLQALADTDDETPPRLQLADTLPADQRALHRRIAEQRWREQRTRLQAIDAEIARLDAQREVIRRTTAKLRATLPLITERAEALARLTAKELSPRHDWLELEQQRIEAEADLATQRHRLAETEAAIEEARDRQATQAAGYRRELLDQLREARRNETALVQELVKARRLTERRRLTAPIDGTVQQLAVHTVGGVVTPAQQLMVVVPVSAHLEVEAMVENRDIGFVHPGERAEVKVDTFPFTKYGTLDATVTTLSGDAVADETRGLIYPARVLLERTTIRVGEKLVELAPGMTVVVEIKTGKRRLIEYFLAPLLKYRDESVRER
ncbi:HlyD family type I secretion periplasmic adaptor subunit [Endothiovibrio diazotrophicus]